MWDALTAKRALQVYHWTFLAPPQPMPERLISPNAIYWLEYTLASWTGEKSLDAFEPDALAHYRAFFNEPSRIHACCEDYRAGATRDYEDDKADRAAGRTIDCPVGLLWGTAGIPAAGASPLDAWQATFAPKATGEGIEGGHFLAEENPAATMHALVGFLTR
jgi:haloacetate dehalogenase